MGREIVIMEKPISAAAFVFRQKLQRGIKQVCEKSFTALDAFADVVVRREKRKWEEGNREKDSEHFTRACKPGCPWRKRKRCGGSGPRRSSQTNWARTKSQSSWA